MAFTELNDQCYVCNNVTNAGAEIACELTERMVMWLNHVMELTDYGKYMSFSGSVVQTIQRLCSKCTYEGCSKTVDE